MADGVIQVPADSTGKKVDTSEIVVAGQTVERQRIVIADGSASAEFATVTGGILQVGGVMNVSAMPAVNISAMPSITVATLPNVNISATANVVIGAGSANIGSINNISRTVAVVLAAGTANFGVLDSISKTVAAVIAAGTANIGSINNISATVAAVLGAGAANIGVINNISATVNVAGTVALGAGAANIGTLNGISATVNVAIGTPFTVNAISATVTVAGVVNLSATAAITMAYVQDSASTNLVKVGDSANSALRVNVVAGSAAGVSQTDNTSFTAAAAPFAPFGGIFDDVSTNVLGENKAGVARLTSYRGLHVNLRDSSGNEFTAGAATGLPVTVLNATATSTVVLAAGSATIGTVVAVRGPIAIMSASHGPKCVTASTSSNVTLIASPGAGANIYITQIMCGSEAASLTKARVGTSASIATVLQPLAANGGGFVLNFDPPWMLSASEAAVCSVKPNASQVYFTVNYFVK